MIRAKVIERMMMMNNKNKQTGKSLLKTQRKMEKNIAMMNMTQIIVNKNKDMNDDLKKTREQNEN